MKVAIGLLLSHGFPAPVEFWDSYELVMTHLTRGECNKLLPERQQITGVGRLKSSAFPPDVGRNQIVRAFLEGDADWLFFMDADMVFPADVVTRLLQADKPVITARYHGRRPPHHAIAYVKHRRKDGPHCYASVHFGQGVFEIERGGAGALLIRRDVLEAIQFRIGENWFRYQRGPTPPYDMDVSEDFWFYRQAREAGFQCWCDWDVECEHLQLMGVNEGWNRAYLTEQIAALARLPEDKRKEIMDSFIACGYPDGLTLSSGDHVPAYQILPGER